jgi:hypothetical protein
VKEGDDNPVKDIIIVDEPEDSGDIHDVDGPAPKK